MPKGIVIRADMKAPDKLRDFDTVADFATVVGNPMKVIPIPQLGVAVVANAEGNHQRLPVNTYATLLWWFWVPALRKQVVLLGDVVLMGEPDPDGQPTNVPAPFAGTVLSQHGHIVRLRIAGEREWYRSEILARNYFEAIVFAFDLLDSRSDADLAQIVPLAARET